MTARGTVEKRALSGLESPIELFWPEQIDMQLGEKILKAMNRVLEREDTIGFPGPLSYHDGMEIISELNSAVLAGHVHVLLARNSEGDIVGHSLLSQKQLPNCRHVGEISRTFADPSYRGLTILRLGVKAILEKCDQLSIEMLQLDVRAGTRIYELWKRMGFEPIGIMPDYARVNGKKLNGCYMYQTVQELKNKWQQTSTAFG